MTSVTQSGATGRSLAASLGAAREELRADIARGAGGRVGARALFRSRRRAAAAALLPRRRPAAAPVAVLALGGYGRRHLCLHSDIDLLVLFGGAIGAAEEAFLRAFLHPLWDLGVVVGHQVRELRRLRAARDRQPRVPAGAARRAARRRRARSCSSASRRVFHTAEHARLHPASRCSTLIDERHAGFNGTLYQLEPDVKEAPGALRDLSATRTIALLTDPLLLRKGPTEPARFDDAEDFLLRVRSIAAPRGRAQPERARATSCRSGPPSCWAIPGAEPRQRVERLMSDYFRHARIVNRSLELGAAHGAACRSARTSGCRATASASSIRCRRRATRRRGWARSRRRSTQGTAVSEEALSCIQQHVDRYRADDFFPTPPTAPRCCAFLQAAAGTLRPAVARCTTAACSGGCSRSSRRSRGAWCATSTTSTRSTSTRCSRSATSSGWPATDEPERAALPQRARRAGGAGAAGAGAAASTTSASGATTTTRSRASGWPSGVLTRLQVYRRGARDGAVPDPPSPRMSLVAFRRDTEDPDIVKRVRRASSAPRSG